MSKFADIEVSSLQTDFDVFACNISRTRLRGEALCLKKIRCIQSLTDPMDLDS